ncbi:class I SAM-dependent methyltransferase [Priestia megaterium]|nr:class I SAM-dependent methyltransferase [Priestia megaterium]
MREKDLVVSQFGKNAANYVKSIGHARGKDLNVLFEIASENHGKSLLDIATGGGHVVNKLAPLFNKAVALDLTPGMLERAEQLIKDNGHSNVSFVRGDAENLPFQEETFSTVTCRIAPHHFPNVTKFVRETFRVLKQDGVFLLIDNVSPEIDEYDQFYNFIEKKRDPSHYRAYKKTEWLAMLEKNGFRVEMVTTFPKIFLFDDWCKMMNVSERDKAELNVYMTSMPQQLQNFFSIKSEDGNVKSFQGEAMLMVGRK